MKKLKYILFVLLILIVNLEAQQLKVLSEPDFKESMKDIFFINESTGWMVGSKGSMFKTSDGGNNWVSLNTGVTGELQKVFFIDENIGWAGLLTGSILKTTNGGSSWIEYSFTNVSPNIVFSLFDVLYFTDANNGYVVAGKLKNNYLLRTTDGGITWSIKDSLVSSTAMRWYDLEFNQTKGALVGDKKDAQRYTLNNGDIWLKSTPIVDSYFRDLKAVRWLDASTLIAIGEGNEFNGVPTPLYKSTDGGINWVKKNQSINTLYDRIKDAYFKNSSEGIGVGSNGFSRIFILKTNDGGETWTASTTPFAFGLQALSGVSDKLFALGSSSHVLISSDFGNNWSGIKKKTPSSILGVQFISGKGYAVTRNGDFYVSNNGTGNSWQYLSSTGADEVNSLIFLTSETGFLLKENRHISKTTDGGITWRTVLTPEPANARSKVGGIAFGDANTGYAWLSLNEYGAYFAYKTVDGGENWSQLATFAGPGYISGNVVSFDASTAVLLGPDNWTKRTTDGGSTWNDAVLIDFPPSFNLRDFEDVVQINSNKAIAIGEGFICITTDKGANWKYVNHNITTIDSSFYTIANSGDSLIYIGCYNGVILKSTDGGVTWLENSNWIDQHFFYSAGLTEKGKLFLGTSDGFILGEETVSDVNEDVNEIWDFNIEQNFPNPFNPYTFVKYRIDKAANVRLTLFDIMGREIAVLKDSFHETGDYSYKIDAGEINISSGSYFLKLSVNGKSKVIKLQYLK